MRNISKFTRFIVKRHVMHSKIFLIFRPCCDLTCLELALEGGRSIVLSKMKDFSSSKRHDIRPRSSRRYNSK
jgi:hypothetical protein